MDKSDLIKILATRNNMPPADAADELDRVVNNILLNLRRGQAVSLPGIGVLRPSAHSGVRFFPVPAKEPK